MCVYICQYIIVGIKLNVNCTFGAQCSMHHCQWHPENILEIHLCLLAQLYSFLTDSKALG